MATSTFGLTIFYRAKQATTPPLCLYSQTEMDLGSHSCIVNK